MAQETNTGASFVPAGTGYLALVRRLNLLRQVIAFRETHGWTEPAAALERTRRFFASRGSVPYQRLSTVPLGTSDANPYDMVSVHFGPAGSSVFVVIARRAGEASCRLITYDRTGIAERETFPLDERFGIRRDARISGLLAGSANGALERATNPVEFATDEQGRVVRIVLRVSVTLENWQRHDMPAQIIGTVDSSGISWTVFRLGQAQELYPTASEKLFLPGYEPRAVVFGTDNDSFICTGFRRGDPSSPRVAVWNDRWDPADPRTMVDGLDPAAVGPVAVGTFGRGRAIYGCILGALPEDHPFAARCPGIVMATDAGSRVVYPIPDIVDVRNVLGLAIGGPSCGFFHCLRRGPSGEVIVYQNGVPIGVPFEGVRFYGLAAEDVAGPPRHVRAMVVTADENARALYLHVATSTAWPETYAMMRTSLDEVRRQVGEQDAALRRFQKERQGNSLTVLGLGRLAPQLDRGMVLQWWSYVAGKVAQRTGGSVGPYLTRRVALDLLETYRAPTGELRLEPLLLPLADLFGLDVRTIGRLDEQEDFLRFRRDIRQFLASRRLVISADEIAPDGSASETVLVIHPAALRWTEEVATGEEALVAATQPPAD